MASKEEEPMRGWRAATIAALAVTGVTPAGATAHGGHAVRIDVLSSRPNQVSGGDALVRVTRPPGSRQATVERNGEDVTAAFKPQGDGLVGLVDGFDLGNNEPRWHRNGKSSSPPADRLQRLPDRPGPMFSGPQQYPFVCKTRSRPGSLGEPIVDNQAGVGFRVLNPDGSTAGWSRDCSAQTVVDYLYRTHRRAFKPLPAGPRPGRHGHDPTLDGRTVDFVVRRERGTINRFLYCFAMLAPFGEDPATSTPRCGTASCSTRSTAAWRSATAKARSAAPGSTRTCSARATRSSIRAAPTPTPTTTSSSAARQR